MNDTAGLSIPDLFMQAGLIVKIVMLILMSASVWCWAIIFEKITLIKSLNHKSANFEDLFWKTPSLSKLYDSVYTKINDPLTAIFAAAMKEWKKATVNSYDKNFDLRGCGVKERVERAMNITMDKEIARLEKKMTILASTGSVSPFIGLFGTVWGIMGSFHNIGMMQDTSLAVVAPGIAEALLATALGLVAAIPAVIAYNKISTEIDRFAAKMENFAGEFSTILSRQIDEISMKSNPDNSDFRD